MQQRPQLEAYPLASRSVLLANRSRTCKVVQGGSHMCVRMQHAPGSSWLAPLGAWLRDFDRTPLAMRLVEAVTGACCDSVRNACQTDDHSEAYQHIRSTLVNILWPAATPLNATFTRVRLPSGVGGSVCAWPVKVVHDNV